MRCTTKSSVHRRHRSNSPTSPFSTTPTSLDGIRTAKELTDTIQEKLLVAIREYNETFAAQAGAAEESPVVAAAR